MNNHDERLMTIESAFKEMLEKVKNMPMNRDNPESTNIVIALSALIDIKNYPNADMTQLLQVAIKINTLINDLGKESILLGFMISRVFALQMLLKKHGIDHKDA